MYNSSLNPVEARSRGEYRSEGKGTIYEEKMKLPAVAGNIASLFA